MLTCDPKAHVKDRFFYSYNYLLFISPSPARSVPLPQQHLQRSVAPESMWSDWSSRFKQHTSSVVLKWDNGAFLLVCLAYFLVCLFMFLTLCCEGWWKLHFFYLWEDRSSVAQQMEVVLNPLCLHLVKEPVEWTCKGSEGKFCLQRSLIKTFSNKRSNVSFF